MLIDLGEVEKECLKIKCILDHNILNNIRIYKDSTESQYNILNLLSRDRRFVATNSNIFRK